MICVECSLLKGVPGYFLCKYGMQAVKDMQAGTRILYVICAEGKANKNITIANLVGSITVVR